MALIQDAIKPATDWLLKQRTETVVLVVILAVLVTGIWRGLPWAADEVKEHVDAINLSHEKQVNKISDTFDRAHDRDSQLIQNLLQSHGIHSPPVSRHSEFASVPFVPERPGQ